MRIKPHTFRHGQINQRRRPGITGQPEKESSQVQGEPDEYRRILSQVSQRDFEREYMQLPRIEFQPGNQMLEPEYIFGKRQPFLSKAERQRRDRWLSEYYATTKEIEGTFLSEVELDLLYRTHPEGPPAWALHPIQHPEQQEQQKVDGQEADQFSSGDALQKKYDSVLGSKYNGLSAVTNWEELPNTSPTPLLPGQEEGL